MSQGEWVALAAMAVDVLGLGLYAWVLMRRLAAERQRVVEAPAPAPTIVVRDVTGS